MSRATIRRTMREHRGATIIFVALAMVMILGFAALAVDVGYLYVVRNQLQNAADSGALAGAQVLYNDAGTSVNEFADDVGADYARSHLAEQAEVVVLSSERGHWSFATRTFTPNDSLDPVDLWDVTTEELDANTNFINAVRVTTRRTRDAGTLPAHFFGQIFGGPRAEVITSAVGYIGFAGTVEPDVLDQPIAICENAIRDGSSYTCGVGRMINSGSNPATGTGGWTNFSQQPCETTSVPTVKPLVCLGNQTTVTFGNDMGTVGGMQDTVFDDLVDCWARLGRPYNRRVDDPPTTPVRWRLPVIECPSNNVLPCSRVIGTVEVDVVWINHQEDPQFAEVPRQMLDPRPEYNGLVWTCSSPEASGQQCWNEFAEHFDLMWDATSPAHYDSKSIYFLPNCAPHIPRGITGGENFGILAKIPVLVK